MSVDVAIYLPSLRGGGAERVMLTLANGMAERGLKVDLVLANAIGPYLTEVAPGVRIVNLGVRRALTSLPGLVRYLRRERPQAMLSALNYANVIAVLARMISGIEVRLLVSEHNHVSKARAGLKSLRAKAVLPLMYLAYRRADGVIAVSQGVADDLAEIISLPHASISVIYNPVVTRELFDKAQTPLDHSWLGQNNPPIILGAGRLTKQKDFKSLIAAFAQVRSQLECRLIILGEGELRVELETQVRELHLEESVKLLGFVDNPFSWMSRVELFVFSSAWEGFGNVLVEAMACGAQVVSTDCPSGPSEILEAGRWGRLVPVGDVKALADGILEALRAPSQLDVSSRVKEFKAELIVDQYIQALLPDMKAVPSAN